MTALSWLTTIGLCTLSFLGGYWLKGQFAEFKSLTRPAEPIGFADVDHDFLAHRESAQ